MLVGALEEVEARTEGRTDLFASTLKSTPISSSARVSSLFLASSKEARNNIDQYQIFVKYQIERVSELRVLHYTEARNNN